MSDLLCNYNSAVCPSLSQYWWWLSRQRVNEHALETLKHSEGVLICIDVLCPGVAIYKFFNACIIVSQTLEYFTL